MYDKKLTARIIQYVSENKYIDFGIMASDLQLKYPNDYARRKKNSFKKLVGEIYSTNSALKRRTSNPNHETKRRKTLESTDENLSGDSDFYVEYEDTNLINDSLSSMYNGDVSHLSSGVKLSPSNKTYSYDSADIHNDIIKSTLNKKQNENIAVKADAANEADNLKINEPKVIKKKTKKRGKNTHSTDPAADIEEIRKSKYKFEKSKTTFSDVGGNEKTLQDVCKLLIHIKHPEVYTALGVTPPHGVLLHGPPGCGKSLLANAIAGEMELPMLKLAAPEIVSGISGESEQKLRDVFEVASDAAPCIVFIDEIDSIAPKRETASKEQERRIVAQMLSCMDDLSSTNEQVLIIGATNRPDAIDPALRRAGRFDREISIGIPSEKAREQILMVLCKNLKLQDQFDFSFIARLTPGYVGADLLSLCRESAAAAVSRVMMTEHSNVEDEADMSSLIKNMSSEDMLSWIKNTTPLSDESLEKLTITMQDFEEGMKDVQPSAKREGFATVPDVTWEDVGALKAVRHELSLAILAPVRNPEVFSTLGLEKPSGVLLAGPPGCGKTMLAKAIANESGINFISVKGPELLNMYVGESERAVRQCFQRAQNSSPCVIFFDELDSLCPKRSSMDTGSSARVVNQMLTEMDGLQSRKQVFVMAATNRPDIIDPAILRPGRLDKCLYVDLPQPSDRLEILNAITKCGTRPLLASDLSLEIVANDSRCNNFTGADLSALVREASVSALKEHISQEHVLHAAKANVSVKWENFNEAFGKVKPSVSPKDLEKYAKLKLTNS